MQHDLVLVYPDASAGRFTAFRKHLGASYLLAYLQERGLDGAFYTQSGTLPLQRAADEIAAMSRRYVGFTCFDSNFYYVNLLARLIKQRAPELTVLVGGPSPTFSSELILDHVPEIDACFTGMAEEALAQYLEAPEDEKNTTPSLVYRDGDRIVHNPPRLTSGGRHGADRFPSPYLAGVLPFEDGPTMGLLSSRGCFYRCTYCSFSAMANWRIQFHSPGRVLSELAGIHDRLRGRKGKGGRRPHVVFYDDFFTANRARLTEICTGMIDSGAARDLTFKCCTRADWVDLDILRMLKEAGFTKIVFGLESGSPEVLERIKKLHPTRRKDAAELEPEREFLAKFRQSVAEAKQVGLEVHSSIIVGLPGETPEQARQTIDMVESLGLDGYNHNYLQIFPGTELFERAEEYGIRFRPSATLLPYLTYYTYDVTRVPVLDLQGNIAEARRQMAGDLSRAFHPQNPWPEADTVSTVYAEVEDPAADRRLWSWLGESISPLTRLVFHQCGTGAARPEDVFPRLIDSSVPVLNYLSVYTGESEDGEAAGGADEQASGPPKLLCEDIRRGTRAGSSVLGMEVRRMEVEEMCGVWSRLLAGGKPEPAFYTCEIGDAEGLEALGAFLRRRAPEGRLALSRALLEQGQQITDACRFGLRACPTHEAAGFPNAVVSLGGTVRPCFAGPTVGDTGDRVGELRRGFDTVFHDREYERGCGDCRLAATCSRCPTLECGPLRRGEVYSGALAFVELLRHRAQVLGLLERAEGGRLELVLGSLAFPRGHNGVGGEAGFGDPARLPGSVLELTDGETFFLLDVAGGEVYELTRPMVEIYEAVAHRAEGEEVVGYFTDRYGIDRGEVTGSIHSALGIFEQIFHPGETGGIAAAPGVH